MYRLTAIILVIATVTADGIDDCSTTDDLVSVCAKANLAYLHGADQELKNVGNLLEVKSVLDMTLNVICNDTTQLKNYYMCVVNGLHECLAEVNSTHVDLLPAATNIADGIEHLCMHRGDLNKTCLNEHFLHVEECVAKKIDAVKDYCQPHEITLSCAEERLQDCEGSDAFIYYIKQSEPQSCNSGFQASIAFSLLLLTVLTHLTSAIIQ